MTTTEFQAEFLSRATLPKADDAATLIDEYVATRTRTLAQAAELGVGNDGAGEIAAKLAKAFIRRWMMLKYAAIDLSFADRPWWLTVERVDDAGVRLVGASESPQPPSDDPVMKLVGSIPRFFRASDEAKDVAFTKGMSDIENVKPIGIGGLASGKRKSGHYRAQDVRVVAKLPDGLCQRHVNLVRSAVGHFHMAIALLYARGVNLEADLREDTGWNNRSMERVEILWAPNEDAISLMVEAPRPAGDPAVIYFIAGHSFLLDFYDTPDEKPIEHLIREFSEGKLPK